MQGSGIRGPSIGSLLTALEYLATYIQYLRMRRPTVDLPAVCLKDSWATMYRASGGMRDVPSALRIARALRSFPPGPF